jgi:hypothetical protein
MTKKAQLRRTRPASESWYRPVLVTGGVFAAMVLIGIGAIMALRNDLTTVTVTTTTTTSVGPTAPAVFPPG